MMPWRYKVLERFGIYSKYCEKQFAGYRQYNLIGE
jgi:hypothetical protein